MRYIYINIRIGVALCLWGDVGKQSEGWKRVVRDICRGLGGITDYYCSPYVNCVQTESQVRSGEHHNQHLVVHRLLRKSSQGRAKWVDLLLLVEMAGCGEATCQFHAAFNVKLRSKVQSRWSSHQGMVRVKKVRTKRKPSLDCK